ncbi:MAG: hypothetical protein QG657_83 [Acidobacteriota bacterium]|nr:hypothetical protein [Acidobacteriota bacterium]
MSNGTRSQVTGITVRFNDGTEKTYPDANGYMPIALFWSDDAVANILGAYYDGLIPPHRMTYESLVTHFGPIRANAVCPAGPGNSVDLNKNVVTTLWNMPNQSNLIKIMSKDPSCDIGG